ncbi:armadillo repeat-containing protein 7-like isoform X2 [Stylophora pistillata]|uniref:armadillo repeat-containing protein 7-like isoform X2 n=1 Tax=Stylophora pistillata TaxID=50429 RepID=UPI000C057987|nr:armadillo repeat-containing protein 7-like isoform X2 [Stylophora pistillata]
MFTSQARIDSKTGPDNLGRFEYLQALVTEFQDTDKQDMLTEENAKFVEFGIGGLCNCSLDKENKQHIVENGGIPLVINCLSSSNEETVLSAITTLMFLTTPQTQEEITSEPVVDCMERFSTSSNARLSNLAKVFLQDYCKRSKQNVTHTN